MMLPEVLFFFTLSFVVGGVRAQQPQQQQKQGVRRAGPVDPREWPEPAASRVVALRGEADYVTFVRSNRVSLVACVHPADEESQRLVLRFRQAAGRMAGVVAFGKLDYSEPGVEAFAANSKGAFTFRNYPRVFIGYGGDAEGPLGGVGRQLLPAQKLLGPRADPFGNVVDMYHGGLDAYEIEWWMAELAAGRNPIEEERAQRIGLYSGTRNYGWPAHYNGDLEGRADSAVAEIGPEDLDRLLASRADATLYVVKFYSDRCPHCKLLMDDMIKAANTFRLQGSSSYLDVKVVAFNARVYYDHASSAKGDAQKELPRFVALLRGEAVAQYPKGRPMDGANLVRWALKVHEKFVVNATLGVEAVEADEDEDEDEDAPSWRERLGRATWRMLHTMAAAYPEVASDRDATVVRHQLAALAHNYPCEVCRRHLRLKLASPALGPPATKGRAALALWVCAFHNLVNDDLNKPAFPCDLAALDAAYGNQTCPRCGAAAADDRGAAAAAAWDAVDYATDPALVLRPPATTKKVFKRKVKATGGEL